MSGVASSPFSSKFSLEGVVGRCPVTEPDGSQCGETESLGILEEFHIIYAERLKRLDGDSELAMHTLKSWVHDLTEQNRMLVHTVEELERELLKRVDLMHEQLQKTSLVIKRHERLAQREKTEIELGLQQQVKLLKNDISSLLDIVNQAKEEGYLTTENVQLHTVSRSQLVASSPKRSEKSSHGLDFTPNDSQVDTQGDVVALKNQLTEKDAEIHTLLDRIEEMQTIFSLTSKQVKKAVEAEQQSMQEIASNYKTPILNSNEGRNEDSSKGSSLWVQERLKQQQEQVTTLITRVRQLESKYNLMRTERDVLASKLEVLSTAQAPTSNHISEKSLSKELHLTQQHLGDATQQVQRLTSYVKDLEKTQAALTVEVAEKHDQMLALKQQIPQLEEQVRIAQNHTNLKDSIIREMRNELKKASNKTSPESGSVLENTRKTGFSVNSVSDSGVDDADFSSQISFLQSQINEQLKQINEKDKEVCSQKKKVQALQKELLESQKAASKANRAPHLPSISLKELEEYRLCTVEGQAAVEDLRDEIEAIVEDLKSQEAKVADFENATTLAKEIMQNAHQTLSRLPTDPVTIQEVVGEVKACIQDLCNKSEDFVQERRNAEQRRASRERKVEKLQEQLDASHDNMRDGIEAMEQDLAERYEADRLSQKEFSDGSSYHSCRGSDSSSCLKQLEYLEGNNADLLSCLTSMEQEKKDAEAKATHYLREMEKMNEQLARRSFLEELIHTKDQTICELQGALDSTRRQMRDLQSDWERTSKERDAFKSMLEQQSNTGPLQVAELQSELARVRNQLSSLNSKQALVEQYERRLKESSELAEKLSSQLNSLALNLQAKETMLSNKEEMIRVLQDTLDRTREEMKLLKEKSGGPSVSTDRQDQEAPGDVGGVPDEQWQVVRELKLDLSEMLAQYRDCFSEVSRQTRWYRDLREAYHDLRSHAETVKREALQEVLSSQRELETLRSQCEAQSAQICQLREQVWNAELGRQRAESETEELQGRLSTYSEQICMFKSRLESLQAQLKETQTRMERSEEREELLKLREFREKWDRVARTLADIDHQDKDCCGGLEWCESSESEDSQKREAKLEATLGLLMVEAGRRRRGNAGGGSRDDNCKDCGPAGAKSRDCDQQKAVSDSSQGQVQGLVEENQQLRDQLGQLRSHNAALAAQLQEQYEETARCLADVSSSLEDDTVLRRAGSLPRRDRLFLTGLPGEEQPCGPRPARRGPRPGGLVGAAGAPAGRASRASSSSSGSRRHHLASLSPEAGADTPGGPEGSEAADTDSRAALTPSDYNSDLCDSGFWSLQASPPRSASSATSSSPARLCWLERASSPAAAVAASTMTPASASASDPSTGAPHLTASGATAFILNTRRPRTFRH